MSTASRASPGRLRTVREGLDSRSGAARTEEGLHPVLGSSSGGIGRSRPASGSTDVVPQVVQGDASPFAVVATPRLNDRPVQTSALVDQGAGSKTYDQATVLRCVSLMRLTKD